MIPSSFEKVIRLQFHALMLLVIKRTMINHKRQITRRLKYEISYGDTPEPYNHKGIVDTYFYDVTSFTILGFLIEISDYKLATAVQQLPETQRDSILLYYFENMTDREISKICHISRSTACYRRHKGLNKLRSILEERK